MNTWNYIASSNFLRWKWRFLKEHTYILPWSLGVEVDPLRILSNAGNVMVELKRNRLTIKRYYHFDGATFAPDFEKVLIPAALHDALLQLADKYPEHVTYDMANEAFFEEMAQQKFKLRWLYELGVRLWFSLKPRNK